MTPFAQTVAAAQTLDELLAAILALGARANGSDEDDTLTDLPTFGGVDRAGVAGIYSWDATRLLIGPGAAADKQRAWAIIDRAAEPERKFECKDGETTWKEQGTSIDEVLDDLEARADGVYQYDDQKSTFFVLFEVVDEDGTEGSRRVRIDPPEPECRYGAHDWCNDHDVVGGLEENPGVFGSGGGVRIHTFCSRCGCGQIVDTWGQDSSTGEQGLETVSYSPDEYVDAVEARRAAEEASE